MAAGCPPSRTHVICSAAGNTTIGKCSSARAGIMTSHIWRTRSIRSPMPATPVTSFAIRRIGVSKYNELGGLHTFSNSIGSEMMPRLKGQVAFVTGAGRGIGQAMALAFAAEGAIVGVADIDGVTAAATVREIGKNSGIARAFPIDVSRRDDVLRAVAQLVSEFGRLDIVANNAIVFRNEPVSEVQEDTIEKMISVGLKSIFWTA